MDLYEFNITPFNNRAQLVWDLGQYITTRQEEGIKILLYYMGKFFVEVWYSEKDNFIFQIRSFKSSHCLEPYLARLSIDFS